MKILLSDASGLTSRQVATILSRQGHLVHALSPPGITLTKFTTHVAQVHRVPPFGNDPYLWLDCVLPILQREKFDVLVCTQEQVTIISAEWARVRDTGVTVAVPAFGALRRVMDKISACETLREVGLAQPESVVLSSPGDFTRCEGLFPAFVKLPIATGSMGVRRVGSVQELASVVGEWRAFDEGGKLLLQKEVKGPLLMISGVFDCGGLVAWHSCVRAKEGVNGGASKKLSLPHPLVGTHLQRLGKELGWHGALSADAILTKLDGSQEPELMYIDINPRIVEPMNALLSGVNLVDILLRVSLGPEGVHGNEKPLSGKEGVATHQLVLALLQTTKEQGRVMLVAEIFKALFGLGMYTGSMEELTPMNGDLWSVLVLFGMTVMLVVGGRRQAEQMSGGAVSNYAVSPRGWGDIVKKQGCGAKA